MYNVAKNYSSSILVWGMGVCGVWGMGYGV